MPVYGCMCVGDMCVWVVCVFGGGACVCTYGCLCVWVPVCVGACVCVLFVFASFSFSSALILVIAFLLLGLSFVCSCFPSCLRCHLRMCVCALLDFLMQAFRALNFPPSTAFATSQRF